MPLKNEKQLYRGILVLAVALFLIANAFFRLLSDRLLLRIDTTEGALYALSGETQDVLSTLADPTTISVYSAEEDFPEIFRELLTRYAHASPALTVSFVDPYENPVFAEQFAAQGIAPEPSDLLLQGRSGVLRIPYEDLLVQENGEITGIRAEQAISGGILYVNSTERKRALFVTGHNEYITSSLTELFTDNRFEVHTQMLTEESAADTDIIVLASPAQDITAHERTLLSAHLQRGGTLFVFLAPSVTPYPELTALLSSYGMTPGEDVVLDDSMYTGGSPVNVTPYFTTHAANAQFESLSYATVVPSSRSITLAQTGTANAYPLLLTGQSAYAKDAASYRDTEKLPTDATGSFTLAAIAEGRGGEKLFLSGSRLLYADDLMGSPSYANRLFLTGVAAYCVPDTTLLQIPAKEIAPPALFVSNGQERFFSLLFLGLIPLAFLAAGIRITLKRRRL